MRRQVFIQSRLPLVQAARPEALHGLAKLCEAASKVTSSSGGAVVAKVVEVLLRQATLHNLLPSGSELNQKSYRYKRRQVERRKDAAAPCQLNAQILCAT